MRDHGACLQRGLVSRQNTSKVKSPVPHPFRSSDHLGLALDLRLQLHHKLLYGRECFEALNTALDFYKERFVVFLPPPVAVPAGNGQPCGEHVVRPGTIAFHARTSSAYRCAYSWTVSTSVLLDVHLPEAQVRSEALTVHARSSHRVCVVAATGIRYGRVCMSHEW